MLDFRPWDHWLPSCSGNLHISAQSKNTRWEFGEEIGEVPGKVCLPISAFCTFPCFWVGSMYWMGETAGNSHSLPPCARCSFRGKGESTSWVADLSKSCELCKGVVAGTQSHHDLRGFDVLIPIFYLCWCHDLWVRCGHHTNESMTELNPNRKCSST